MTTNPEYRYQVVQIIWMVPFRNGLWPLPVLKELTNFENTSCESHWHEYYNDEVWLIRRARKLFMFYSVTVTWEFLSRDVYRGILHSKLQTSISSRHFKPKLNSCQLRFISGVWCSFWWLYKEYFAPLGSYILSKKKRKNVKETVEYWKRYRIICELYYSVLCKCTD